MRPSYEEAPFSMYNNINLLVVEHCSNTCRHCASGSPLVRRTVHPVASFLPWLDRLEEHGYVFTDISLTGGEPFLHPEVRSAEFMHVLRDRYPQKRLGVTTNFYWASTERIAEFAEALSCFDSIGVSLYANIVERLGGSAEVERLLDEVRALCPDVWLDVVERSAFLRWSIHDEPMPVEGPCVTADCFILRPEGRLSHCAIAIGAEIVPEFAGVTARSNEAFWDIQSGLDGIEDWVRKYPFDLCEHCSMWQGVEEPMVYDDRNLLRDQRRAIPLTVRQASPVSSSGEVPRIP